MSLGSRETFFTMPTRASVYGSGSGNIAPIGLATDGTDMFIGGSGADDGDVLRLQTMASPSTLSVFSAMNDAEHVAYLDGQLYATNVSSGGGFVGGGVYEVGSGTSSLFFQDATFAAAGALHRRPADGTFWVTAWGFDELWELDASGSRTDTHSLLAAGFGAGGTWHDDKLYLTDFGGNGRIVAFDPSTDTFTTIVANIYSSADRGVGDYLAVASDGRIYMADLDYVQLWSCELDGSDIQIDVPAGDPDAPGNPRGLLEIDGYLYVADFGDDAIYRWEVIPSANPAQFGVGFLQFPSA